MTISPHDLEPSDDELDPVVDATGQRSWTDLAMTGVRIVVWTFAYLTFLLGAWVLLGWSLAGWGPVVVTSDSMRPTLDAGDVVLVSADASIGQRDVIVFERGDALIAHRVFAVEDDFFITKGDANASPDTDPVAASDVVGAGRLVIPMVGLPIVWAQTGQWLPFVGWSLLTGAGILGTALAADRAIRRRRDDETDAVVAIARVGVQRVRVLTAVLIGGQLLLGNDDTSLGDGATWLTIGAAAALVATNLLGSTRARAGGNERVTAVIELTIDTTLVVVLALAAGNSLSWILFALPIIEAAVRFRLVGALLHWMALTGGTLAVELWQSADRPSGDTVAALESRLDQLGVLFLFVIPAAYLAEQLLGEVTTWRTATGNAVARGELLARVADVGRDVVRLDGGHLDAIVHGVRSIGFDRADLVMDPGDGRWRVLAGSELPPAGGAASGTRSQDAPSIATIVTPGDPDPAEVGALAEHGLAALVTHVVVDSLNRRIVLRSGIDAGADVTAERIEAFRLLAGQAVVALQNDQLMSEITSMHDELEHRAMHDELTGLPNRALMLRELREATSAWKDSAVLFLDLDGFKPVNDRLGHDIGDVLLRRVAQRLVEQAPEGAVVARLGGDEFTILLTGTDVAQRVSVAERIVASISLPFDIGEQMISISTSIGIAVGDDRCDDAELVRRADVAMYEAKHGPAGSPIEEYDAHLDSDAERRVRLIADLAHAIRYRTIDLAYQPVVDVSGRRPWITGAEALLRWEHPAYGRISPNETIEIAQAANLSSELNALIVLMAVEWVAVAQRVTRNDDLFVTVNASPEELNDSSLARHVSVASDATGVAPESIAVEISERLVTPVTENAQANMATLRAMGVRLLLDDFGEGTTSLTYLQELPIDGIKLDRRLVVNALRSRTDRLVLDSIVKLSTRIGHSVIAEGIETVDHLAAVAEVGCHLVQGYHLHRPMPGDDLISILCDQELRGRESMPVDEQRAEDPAANVADTNVADTNVTDTNVTGSIGHAPNDDWTLPLVSPTVDPFSPPSGAPLPEPIAADVISAEVIPADVIGVPTLPDRTVG